MHIVYTFLIHMQADLRAELSALQLEISSLTELKKKNDKYIESLHAYNEIKDIGNYTENLRA